MKEYKRVISFILVIIAAGAIVFGVRAINNRAALKNVEGQPTVNGLLVESVNYNGDTYIVPPKKLYDLSTEDKLVALEDPTFVSVTEADEYLADDVDGISVEVDGQHRFYSYQMLNWHGVVNDTFNGKQIAVTHCALCRSSRVFDGTMNGERILFDSANLVYNNNLVLENDQTDGLWLQLNGVGITNDAIGQTLEAYPIEIMTWGTWKEQYPEGEALSRDTGYEFDYTSHPYQNYDMAKLVYFPLDDVSNVLGTKWPVAGADYDGQQVAFSHDIMERDGIVQVPFGEQNVVGLFDYSIGFGRVFLAEVDGQTLTFEFDQENMVLTDTETESVWNAKGFALAGELEGSQLERIPTYETFHMCWHALYPDTYVAGVDTDQLLMSEEDTESEDTAEEETTENEE